MPAIEAARKLTTAGKPFGRLVAIAIAALNTQTREGVCHCRDLIAQLRVRDAHSGFGQNDRRLIPRSRLDHIQESVWN